MFKVSLLLLATLGAFSVASPTGSAASDFQPFNEPLLQARQHAVYTSGQYTGPFLSETKGGAWSKGYEKALKLVSQMTIEEKANVTTGFGGKCVGFTGEVPRLGLRGLCLQDSPTGVRPAKRVSQFPSQMCTAASWDRDLFTQRAEALADEFKNKGINIWLGPVTGGPLGRSPWMGRFWEGYGPDPYLNGEASYLTVTASQKNGLMTCSKHYIAYEQETFRNIYNKTEPYSVFGPNEQDPISSNLDDQTLHELYLWPFSEAVRAGTTTVMCGYNMVSGQNACADDHTLNRVLKQELGFNGAVISDWGGTHETLGSVLNGLDVTMPGSAYGGVYGHFFGDELVALVKNNSVPEKRLDDQVLRILTPALELQDLDEYPLPSFDVRNLDLPTNNVRKDHYKIIQQIAEESITLLKNNKTGGGGLPFNKELQSLLVAGQDAGPNPKGWTSCGMGGRCELNADNGTLTMGGGSGYAIPSYIIDPLAAIQHYTRSEATDINIHLDNYNLTNAVIQAKSSHAAVVFLNAYATEWEDRQNLTLWGNADELVKAVAENNNDTVIVIHNPGPVVIDAWIEHPNITAVLMAYLPGQESGSSLPPILFGSKSPSGKLPFTIAKAEGDYPNGTIVSDPVKSPQANFTEKLLIDYRWFDAKNITPRYEFGFGMSYSKFEYGDLKVEKSFKKDKTSIQKTNEKFKSNQDAQGSSIYDSIFKVSIPIKNVGEMDAAEVAQLYIRFPTESNQPPNVLRGFEKAFLKKGETKYFEFALRKKDLSVWNTMEQTWEIPASEIDFFVGGSSRDVQKKGTLKF